MADRTTTVKFHVTVHEEDDGSYWSEVEELPGCFASGFSLEELQEATYDAMQLWLPDGIELGSPRWSRVADVGPDQQQGSRQAGHSHGAKRAQRRAEPAAKRQRMLVCA